MGTSRKESIESPRSRIAGCPTHSRVSNVWETMDQLEATSLLRQFIPTHSNVRSERGTRHKRYRK
jgi:hypothetical protein